LLGRTAISSNPQAMPLADGIDRPLDELYKRPQPVIEQAPHVLGIGNRRRRSSR
jgi:hypothetical protein